MKIIAALLLALALAACAGTAAALRAELDKSTETYKACIAAKGPDGCKTERAIFEMERMRLTKALYQRQNAVPGPNVLPPAFGAHAGGAALGGKVYNSSECIGPVIMGRCNGSILPNRAYHPTCHGTWLKDRKSVV